MRMGRGRRRGCGGEPLASQAGGGEEGRHAHATCAVRVMCRVSCSCLMSCHVDEGWTGEVEDREVRNRPATLHNKHQQQKQQHTLPTVTPSQQPSHSPYQPHNTHRKYSIAAATRSALIPAGGIVTPLGITPTEVSCRPMLAQSRTTYVCTVDTCVRVRDANRNCNAPLLYQQRQTNDTTSIRRPRPYSSPLPPISPGHCT